MKEIDVQQRTESAVQYFKSGYNCAQAVLLAYADLYPVDVEVIKHIGAPLGGGVSRLREICGAVSGMAVIIGLEMPVSDPTDENSKALLYERVQKAAQHFKQKMGSYICADLLQMERKPQHYRPDRRDDAYYAERPCASCVAMAAEILGETLSQREV